MLTHILTQSHTLSNTYSKILIHTNTHTLALFSKCVCPYSHTLTDRHQLKYSDTQFTYTHLTLYSHIYSNTYSHIHLYTLKHENTHIPTHSHH